MTLWPGSSPAPLLTSFPAEKGFSKWSSLVLPWKHSHLCTQESWLVHCLTLVVRTKPRENKVPFLRSWRSHVVEPAFRSRSFALGSGQLLWLSRCLSGDLILSIRHSSPRKIKAICLFIQESGLMNLKRIFNKNQNTKYFRKLQLRRLSSSPGSLIYKRFIVSQHVKTVNKRD